MSVRQHPVLRSNETSVFLLTVRFTIVVYNKNPNHNDRLFGVLLGSQLDCSCELGVGGLDDPGELGRDGVDAAGDPGDELVLGGEGADGLDSGGVVEDALHGAANEAVGLLLVEVLGEAVEGLDGAADVVLDEEPHVGPLGEVGGDVVVGTLEGAGHEGVLYDGDGGSLGEGAAEGLGLGDGEAAGWAGEDHLGSINALLEAADARLLALEGGGKSGRTAEESRLGHPRRSFDGAIGCEGGDGAGRGEETSGLSHGSGTLILTDGRGGRSACVRAWCVGTELITFSQAVLFQSLDYPMGASRGSMQRGSDAMR